MVDETTKRIPVPDRIVRADNRLKLVKAVDELANAVEKLHVAMQKADKKDLEVLLHGNPFTAPGHTDIASACQMAARETMLWAAHLHDPGKFDDLGTKRFPDHHT